MKLQTKKLLCFVMVGFFALMGLWYLLFAPKGETYHEGENRNLAAAPTISFSSFWNGSLSNDLESWLLDRFFARDVAMDISMGIKDLGSIATFEDALVVMGREDDALTNNDLDEDMLEDMVNDLLSTQPDNTDPNSTDPSESDNSLAPEDYPELLAIKSSSGGKITLEVTLEVPITMGNEYQDQLGYIDWEFKIEEIPIDPNRPSTGDASNLLFYGGLLTISIVGIFMLLLFVKRKKKTEED